MYAAPDGDTGGDYGSALVNASTPDSVLRTVGTGASATVFAIPMLSDAPTADHYASTLTTASTTGGAAADYTSELTSATKDEAVEYNSVLTAAGNGGADYTTVLTEAPVR